MRKALTLAALLAGCLSVSAGDDTVKATMKKATQYMMDVAAYEGGFVWNYLPDYSRQWGELEATRTMVWTQSPGTPDVGQVLLDAYHATGDEYYYDCAKRVARCLVRGQLECGGWNYMFDLAPDEESTRLWYATVGRQAWRLEEFQHYYGNATFDDEATQHCTQLLLRLYLEKHDDEFLAPLQKAIRMVTESQYPCGGWPQRYPIKAEHDFHGKADYTPFVTINDNVTPENIELLLQCYTCLGMESLREPILRAMHCVRTLQQPKPLAGWADQYTPDDLKPAHARSYEPRAVNTGTTTSMIHLMIRYYRLTGDSRFLDGLDDAIGFLESMQLPRQLADSVRRTPLQHDEVLLPRFVCPDDGHPLYVHRRGTNAGNGEYYTDEDPMGTIAHYSSFHVASPTRLREELRQVRRWVQKDLQRNSPLLNSRQDKAVDYYYRPTASYRGHRTPTVEELTRTLNDEGYWPTLLSQVSHPYSPLPKDNGRRADSKQFARTMVGDEYDTSPYENHSVEGISTRTYIRNMTVLIHSLLPCDTTLSGLHPERFVSTVEGKGTALYTLTNGDMEACITNYGARLVSLMAPDRDGKRADVVLGFDCIDDYHIYKQNLGSTVGRYAGRIKGAAFSLDGTEHFLQNHDRGGNIAHGGYPGLADRVWDVVDHNDSTLHLRIVSPDGENGFPGNVTIDLTYHLEQRNALTISYEATTDRPTVLNLTNHSFFNLSGMPTGDVAQHTLCIDSKYIARYDKQKNVDGHFMSVKNTPFDFTKSKAIAADIDIYDEQMAITKGYDHSFALRHAGDYSRPAATLSDPASGRTLTVYTTEPALHLYTANGLDGSLTGKRGTAYQRRSAACLETMHFADSPNHPEFPSTTLRPGETFTSKTTFLFSTQADRRDHNLLGDVLLYSGAASLTGLGVVGILSLTK